MKRESWATLERVEYPRSVLSGEARTMFNRILASMPWAASAVLSQIEQGLIAAYVVRGTDGSIKLLELAHGEALTGDRAGLVLSLAADDWGALPAVLQHIKRVLAEDEGGEAFIEAIMVWSPDGLPAIPGYAPTVYSGMPSLVRYLDREKAGKVA